MNLEQFHQLVDDMSAEQGASDALIPVAVRHAVKFFERNWTFRYMGAEAAVNWLASDPFPVNKSLGGRVKSVVSGEVREVGSPFGKQEIGILLTPHGRLDTAALEEKLPVYVYTDSTETCYVRPLLETSSDLELHFLLTRYTDWPTDPLLYSGFTHFLMERMEDLLASQSILALAAMNNDEELTAFYSPRRVDEIKSSIVSDFLFEEGAEVPEW